MPGVGPRWMTRRAPGPGLSGMQHPGRYRRERFNSSPSQEYHEARVHRHRPPRAARQGAIERVPHPRRHPDVGPANIITITITTITTIIDVIDVIIIGGGAGHRFHRKVTKVMQQQAGDSSRALMSPVPRCQYRYVWCYVWCYVCVLGGLIRLGSLLRDYVCDSRGFREDRRRT